MENHATEHNTTIFLPICDKGVTADVGVDLSMPDYQPEIRRLLRVRATALPPTPYVGGGKAEFAGTVCFHLLYSGNDGALYTATATEEYRLAAPLDKEAEVDLAGELPAFCDPSCESATGRVTAPRRVYLRCRVGGRVRAFGPARICEKTVGRLEGGMERLAMTGTCAYLSPRAMETVTLDDELTVGEGDLRVIDTEVAVCVPETVTDGGGVDCRGEAVLRLLVCREGSEELPFSVSRRIPFTAHLAMEDAEGCGCRVVGRCTEVSTDVTEDGRVLCHLSVTLLAEAQGNREVGYIADLYSVGQESRTVRSEYVFPVAGRCFTGNFTQSVYEPLSSFGLAEDCEVLDVSGTATADRLSFDKDKWVLTGQSDFDLLVRTGDEYASHRVSLPFRYETEGEGGEAMLSAVDVQMTSGRGRTEGGRLSLECEMWVTARVCTEGRLTAVCEVQLGERTARENGETVAVFPLRGERLWDLAKRYRVPSAALCRLNDLSLSPTTPLDPHSPMIVWEE